MKRALLIVVALVACRSNENAPPVSGSAGSGAPVPAAAPAPAIDRAALLAGTLPEGAPEIDLINAQCRICHTTEYLTQQRLTEPAWKKTIDKMRKFGAALDEAQAASLAAFAARYWNPDLPPRTWEPGPPPPGALPIAAAAPPAK